MSESKVPPEADSVKTSLLVEEYRLAEEYAKSADQRVFQLAAILIAASLGTFALIAGQGPISPYSVLLTCLGGAFSITLIIIWYLIMERFASFISVSYYRARELEVELGFWKNRYIHHLDNPRDAQLEAVSEGDKLRLKRLDNAFRDRFRRTNARSLLKLLVFVIPTFWAFWIFCQLTWLAVAGLWKLAVWLFQLFHKIF